MKNRLIELLQDIDRYPEKTCPKYGTGEECGDCQYKLETEKGCDLYARKADYMIAKGLIYPPCKVGQTLYFLYDRTYANRPDFTPRIYETNDWYFDIDEKGISILPRSIHGYKGKHHYYLGETVFLTKEEAEQALRKEDEGK